MSAIRDAVRASIASNFFAKLSQRKSKEFSFCVGRPWPEHKTLSGYNPDSICVYAYGAQVQHGTMADAENFRDYVNERTGEKNFIYKLVKVK